MSPDGPASETTADKAGLLSVDSEDQWRSSTASLPQTNTIRSNKIEDSRTSLAVPYSIPIRPLSPDTISNLSIDEYEQLQPSNLGQNDSSLSLDTPARTGWRGKLDAFWIRNKGLAFMLLAQIFGVL